MQATWNPELGYAVVRGQSRSIYHELDVEHLVVNEIVHQGLEPKLLLAQLLEAVESRQYDLVSAFDQADRGEQLENQRLGSQALVYQAQRDAVDRLAVLYHHVEAVLVVHDGSHAHDADVDVVLGLAHVELGDVLRPAPHAGAVAQVQGGPRVAVLLVDGGRGADRRRGAQLLFGGGPRLDDALLVAHHAEPEAQVVDEHVQAEVLLV